MMNRSTSRRNPHPGPLPEYRERGQIEAQRSHTLVRPFLVSRANRHGKGMLLLAAGLVAFLATGLQRSAQAADVNTGWGSWWLPPNRSAHGGDIDMLFNVIF